ncbi:MAG: hypothetical protein GY856_43895 [bacterium]|nr:hypothetical protein [bacterium]
MHAAFPGITQGIHEVMKLGAREGKVPGLLDRVGGTLLAHGMALLLQLGFGFLLRDSLLNKEQAEKSEEFFRENFEITDPEAEGGMRYYQGKFLIRTNKPDDDMNVYFRFCPDPEALYKETPFGKALDSSAVVSAEALTEEEAEEIEKDPDRVDMVIRFKDVKSIIGLVGRSDFDTASLLLENIVQMTGNTTHLFKFAAIAKNIELMVKPN